MPKDPPVRKPQSGRASGSGEPIADKFPLTIEYYARRSSLRLLRNWRRLLYRSLLVSCLCMVVYGLVMTQAARTDYANIALGSLALALVPISSSAALWSLRSHEAPISVALLVVSFFFLFSVSALSAARVPTSNSGLLAALALALIGMCHANYRLHREPMAGLYMLDCPSAERLCHKLRDRPKVLRGHEELPDDASLVLIDHGEHHSADWVPLLSQLYLRGAELVPWQKYLEKSQGRVDVDDFDVTQIFYHPTQVLYLRVKRYLDYIIALPFVVLLFPVFLCICAYVVLLDGRPAVFRQKRIGLGGQRFTVYKIRTMRRDAPHHSAAEEDPRIIPGCNWIRRVRADELPQILNIVRGEMSFIGPRPMPDHLFANCAEVCPSFAYRTLIRPGITGWAQVKFGYAGSVKQEMRKLSYDLFYLKHISFDLDLIIAIKTIKILLLGRGR